MVGKFADREIQELADEARALERALRREWCDQHQGPRETARNTKPRRVNARCYRKPRNIFE
jgi:hypothetical protein